MSGGVNVQSPHPLVKLTSLATSPHLFRDYQRPSYSPSDPPTRMLRRTSFELSTRRNLGEGRQAQGEGEFVQANTFPHKEGRLVRSEKDFRRSALRAVKVQSARAVADALLRETHPIKHGHKQICHWRVACKGQMLTARQVPIGAAQQDRR
jgi:hypothetical protein